MGCSFSKQKTQEPEFKVYSFADESSSSIVKKVVMAGRFSVGKTSILSKCGNDIFPQNSRPTIAPETTYLAITTTDGSVQFNIVDTAGQEQFLSITESYFRNAHAAILVYDITNKESFQSLQDWLKRVQNQSPDALIVLVGNKSDLNDERVISYDEASQFAMDNNIDLFYEVSAKLGDGIREMFLKLASNFI